MRTLTLSVLPMSTAWWARRSAIVSRSSLVDARRSYTHSTTFQSKKKKECKPFVARHDDTTTRHDVRQYLLVGHHIKESVTSQHNE